MKLIGLLVPLCLIPVMEGEVIPNMVTPQNPNNIPFGPCTRYFLNNQPITPPALVRPRYQQICQMLGGFHRYATLYDTQNRIPVYSAYHYTIHPPGLNEIGWMIEPQLDGYNNFADMRVSGQGAPTINQHGNVGNAQAINADYNQVNNPNGYQKGHLFARNHCSNQIEADSTHTLTNAAPQAGQDNRVWYRQVEKEIACSIRARCTINPPLILPYVVTGVIPSNNVPPLNGRVNVPTHYWSAFCCRDRMNQNNFISEGYVMVMNGLGTGQLTTYGTAQGAQNQFNQLNVFLGFNVFGQQPGCS